MSSFKSREVTKFIAKFPPKTRSILNKIRAVIRKAVPQAQEYMGYGVPGYRLNGPLVYFAAFTAHAGLYPGTAAIRHFKKELSKYSISKGTVRFPLDQPVPYGLIGRITKYRAAQNTGSK